MTSVLATKCLPKFVFEVMFLLLENVLFCDYYSFFQNKNLEVDLRTANYQLLKTRANKDPLLYK